MDVERRHQEAVQEAGQVGTGDIDAVLGEDRDARRRATYVLETLGPAMARYPTAFGHMLGNADVAINGAIEIAIVGEPASQDFRSIERAVHEDYLPSLVLAGGSDANGIALLQDRTVVDGKATAYVCRNYSCNAPTNDARELREQLLTAARVSR